MHYTKRLEVDRAWAIYGLPTECGASLSWYSWYLQMRRPGLDKGTALLIRVMHGGAEATY